MLPIETATLFAFILAAGAIVMSPGPDTMLIIRYTLTSGQKTGFATVLGVQLGLLVHTALAVAGVSVIIASSPVLFRLVAVAGAVYLGWLGLQGLRGGGSLSINGTGAAVKPRRACMDAILCNILNPKVILLFLALFPNFVEPARGNTTAQLITLAITLIVVNVLWQAPLAWAAERARRWLKRPAVQTAVNRGTGLILLAFAALLLYEQLL
ncbi:MAG: LysE family translocator [Rhodospirillales bacterium]|nr:LysE family translocator [Rhodospirillales bacterium]